MKKLYVSHGIVIVILLALTACQVREGETQTITAPGPTTTITVTTTATGILWLDIPTYNQFWGTITTAVGDEFAIALYRNPRLGLNWYETYDENLLVLLESAYQNYSTSFTGGEGDQYFIFKALRQGSTEITFVYKHGFSEADILEHKVFKIDIR